MGLSERLKIADAAAVGVHDVVPEAPPPEPVLPPPPEAPTPTQAAQTATVEQTGADPPPACPCDAVAAELTALRHNYRALAARVHRTENWIDTVSSPLYKRLWFVVCGYRWRRLGRWWRPTGPPWPPPSEHWWV